MEPDIDMMMAKLEEDFAMTNRPRAIAMTIFEDHIHKLYTDGSVYRLNDAGKWHLLPDDEKFPETID